ncbi:MAG: hypothetical protein ABJM43_14380 [Paracoccaceae bacterium]
MINTIVGGTLAFLLAFSVSFAPTGSGPYLTFAFLIWLFWAFLCLGIEGKKDQSRLAGWAKWLPLPYDIVIEKLLYGLPRLLIRESMEERPPPTKNFWVRFTWSLNPRPKDGPDKIRLAHNPWSWPIFDVAIKLAIFYPLFFALIQWTFLSRAINFGELSLLPNNVHIAFRGVALGVLSWFFISMVIYRFLAKTTQFKRFIVKIANWAIFLIVPLVTTGVVIALQAPFEAYVALATAVYSVFLGAVVLRFSGALALIFLIASSISALIAFEFESEMGKSLVRFFSLVGVFLFSIAASWAVAWAARNKLGLTAYLLLSCSAIYVGLTSATNLPKADSTAFFIVSLILLPAINVMFDWVSYGITMSLLRKGHTKRGIWPLVLGVVDFAAAIAMFFALSLTLCMLIYLINAYRPTPLNAYRPTPLIDLRLLLAGIKHAPGDHLWVIAMIGSTLLPTLLHVGIAVLSILTWFPAKLWDRMVEGLDTTSGTLQVPLLSSVGLTVVLAVYAILPALAFYGIGWVIWNFGAELRIWYVDQIAYILSGWSML